MIAQISAYTGKMLDHIDPMLGNPITIADTGQLEEMGRVQCAGA